MTKGKITTLHLVLCAMFTALIAVGAFIRIPIPPVAVTLQDFFTLMAGYVLGKKYGAISTALYMALGLIGLPIFTSGGGPAAVLTPSFGYIIGFIAGAFFAGWWIEFRKSISFGDLCIAGIGNILLIYLIGCGYAELIAVFVLKTPIAAGTLLVSYFAVFLPGDIAKMLLAALLCRKYLPLFRKYAHLPIPEK